MNDKLKEVYLSSDRRGRVFRYAPVVVWIMAIFYLSSSAGSASNTSRFLRPLLEWLFPNTPEAVLTVIHGYIRKGAHLFMYGSLAAIAWRAFIGSSRALLARTPMLSALFVVVAIGTLDELNQSFNLLRTGKPSDVIVDLCGGLVAVLIITAVKRIRASKPST